MKNKRAVTLAQFKNIRTNEEPLKAEVKTEEEKKKPYLANGYFHFRLSTKTLLRFSGENQHSCSS